MRNSIHSTVNKGEIVQWIVIIFVVVNFSFLGYYYVTWMRADYGDKISALQSHIDALQLDLAAREQEIQGLNSRLTGLSSEVTSINDDYEMQISRLDQRIGDLQVDSDSFSGIISDVIDATVSVNTNVGQGSGAIISEDGYVVTNYHVIKGARRASVTSYSGDVYGIRLIGYDATNDIAVLELVSNESFDYFIFGNSDNIEIGQKVVALGNPLGLSFTATEGIISSPSRVAQDGLTYIQTDVTLNPGNSGGPIIDSNGRLIGIANFKVAGYEGLGFAIPSNRVEDVVREIIQEHGQ